MSFNLWIKENMSNKRDSKCRYLPSRWLWRVLLVHHWDQCVDQYVLLSEAAGMNFCSKYWNNINIKLSKKFCGTLVHWITLFGFHWKIKGNGSHVNLVKHETQSVVTFLPGDCDVFYLSIIGINVWINMCFFQRLLGWISAANIGTT